jgi:capsular polysaccharide biosynthesis protein
MSDRWLDLRRSLQILRRRLAAVGIFAALGFIAGACFTAFLYPPMPTSSALVVLPASTSDTMEQAATATSDPVLASALRSVHPAISLQTMQNRVQAASLSPDLLAITAQGETAAQAISTANAAAASYVAYVGSAYAPGGQVPARVLADATDATAPRWRIDILVTAVLGAAAGALIGAAGVLATGRADRRLRTRDEIADAIGVPVLASVRVRHPARAGSWTRLLARYEPSVTDAWRLGHALSDLGLGTATSADPGADGSSLTVLSLSSDRRALALGPQLAVFAASCEIPTTLVIGPQQGSRAAAGLRAAAAAPPSPRRSSRLRVTLTDDDHLDRQDAALRVVVAVVDDRTPRVAGPVRTGATVLGVSAGTATAEQLARVAANAAAHGRYIAGILVADPDPADPTTGRLPQIARPTQGPTRMTSMIAVNT